VGRPHAAKSAFQSGSSRGQDSTARTIAVVLGAETASVNQNPVPHPAMTTATRRAKAVLHTAANPRKLKAPPPDEDRQETSRITAGCIAARFDFSARLTSPPAKSPRPAPYDV